MKKRILSVALALVLLLALYMPLPTHAAAFADTVGHWAGTVIDKWSGYGVIKGDGGRFRPNDYITRGDLAIIISRVMNFTRVSTGTFKDIDKCTAEQKTAILKLNSAGIMLGDSGYMRPFQPITREEATVMLGRAMRVEALSSGGKSFKDLSSMASWSVGYIRAMSAKGYIDGRDTGYFDPRDNITRAEVVKIFDNMIKGYYYANGTYSASAQGNVIINTTGVELKSVAISGDLIITEGVADGTVTLTDVTVSGTTYIMGGGPSSIKLQGRTHLEQINHEKIGTTATRYDASPGSMAESLYVTPGSSPIEYQGLLRTLILNAPNHNTKLTGALVTNLIVNETGITLVTDENTSISEAKVNRPLTMLGRGIISELQLAYAANGSSFDRQPKTTQLPSGTSVFMGGQSYNNTTNNTRTITSSEETTAPYVANGALQASKMGSNAVTISWNRANDNITAQNKLRYALFYSKNPNMYTVANIEQYGVMATSYTADAISGEVSGLVTGETYYFNIIVKDEAENKSCYTRLQLTIGNDSKAPTLSSSTLWFSDLSTTTLTVNWTAATDDVTAQSKLRYSVYRSEYANLDTLYNCENNGTQVMQFTENVTKFAMTALTEGKRYYFNVVAMDESGNKTVYAMASEYPQKDVTSPTLTSSAINVSNQTASSAYITWTAAKDNSAQQDKLKYTVYRSDKDDISTLAQIKATGSGKTQVMAATENRLYCTVSPPVDATSPTGYKIGTYYFNVVVQDTASPVNETCYTRIAIKFGSDSAAPTIADRTVTANPAAGGNITISWKPAADNVTPVADLEYAVYSSPSPMTSVTQVNSWTKEKDFAKYSGTAFSTPVQAPTASRYYNVIVRDQMGNQSLYNQVLYAVADGTAPTPGSIGGVAGRIQAEQQSATSMKLTWGAATDNATLPNALRYTVYWAFAGTDFGDVSKIETNRTGTSGMLAAGQTTYTVSDLTTNKAYVFCVIVQDTASPVNKAAYTPVTATPQSDTTPPNITIATVYCENQNDLTFDLRWYSAIDEDKGGGNTAQDSLLYSIYYSTSDYSMVDNVISGATPYAAAQNATGASLMSGTNLKKSITMTTRALLNFYVVVSDAVGNKSMYSKVVVDTRDKVAPVPGGSVQPANSAISYVVNANDGVITFTWIAGSDDVTSAVTYEGYVKTDDTIINNLTALRATTPNFISSTTLTYSYNVPAEPQPGTYYFNVAVVDEAGNAALHTSVQVIFTPTP